MMILNRIESRYCLTRGRPFQSRSGPSGGYAGREDDVEEATIGGATAAAEEDMYGERERGRKTDGRTDRA